MIVLDDCFGCLFQMTFLDDCSGWLFQMTVPDAYFRWLFQVSVLDDCLWFNDWFIFYWAIPISTADSHFNQSFSWLVPQLIHFWKTASYCRIMALTHLILKNWAWTFIHTSWALQYVSERVLFSRLFEGLIGGPCI